MKNIIIILLLLLNLSLKTSNAITHSIYLGYDMYSYFQETINDSDLILEDKNSSSITHIIGYQLDSGRLPWINFLEIRINAEYCFGYKLPHSEDLSMFFVGGSLILPLTDQFFLGLGYLSAQNINTSFDSASPYNTIESINKMPITLGYHCNENWSWEWNICTRTQITFEDTSEPLTDYKQYNEVTEYILKFIYTF